MKIEKTDLFTACLLAMAVLVILGLVRLSWADEKACHSPNQMARIHGYPVADAQAWEDLTHQETVDVVGFLSQYLSPPPFRFDRVRRTHVDIRGDRFTVFAFSLEGCVPALGMAFMGTDLFASITGAETI